MHRSVLLLLFIHFFLFWYKINQTKKEEKNTHIDKKEKKTREIYLFFFVLNVLLHINVTIIFKST